MKEVICYLRTIKKFDMFLFALFNYGAIYVAHDYKETEPYPGKYIKSRKRFEHKIVCQTCGHVSIDWSN